MQLPTTANGVFVLRDVSSGLSVSIQLQGTTSATAETANGYLVYSAGYEGSADLLNRPSPSGTEQSISFTTRPSAEQATYFVTLDSGVRGVRLIANTVEFLDAGGAPRVRMAAPFIAGAQSTSGWPTVSVASCSVDTNPAPPWGRPLTPPDSRTCALTVDWSQLGIQYPALLDPSWSVGSTMAIARAHHASTTVTANGKQFGLVAGGYAFTSTIASAELFDQTTGTWAQTGSLVTPVSYMPAITLSSGTAIVLGGFEVTSTGGVETDSVQAYNPTAGTWSVQGHLGSAREEHTATLLSTGNVLVAGGFGAYPQIFSSALLYSPTTGQATAAGSMQSARGDHSATLLSNGNVLVVDGLGANAAAQSAADLYTTSSNTWSVVPAPPISARYSHAAPLLSSGNVLIVGGEDPVAGIAKTLGTAVYNTSAGTWSTGPSTLTSHYLGTATVLTSGSISGDVLLAGGDLGLTAVELFSTSRSTWTPISPLLTGRDSHVAVTLTGGLLLAGGTDGQGDLLSSAELYQPATAATAPQWSSSTVLTVVPATSTTATVSWSAATDSNGVASYVIYENGTQVATVSGATLSYTLTGLTPGANLSITVQALDPSGAGSWNGPTTQFQVAPINRTTATSIANATSFLYSGTNPVQTEMDASIVPTTAAVIRGYVDGPSGAALAGVTVGIVNHPEFGTTVTLSDGSFAMAVNGGRAMTVGYSLTGYLPAQRTVQVPWQDYAVVPTVVLMQPDTNVTTVNFSNATSFQVAQGSMQTDSSGTRQATILVPPSTTATLTTTSGSTTMSSLHVRATEYTVGSNGPSAMPGTLPPASAYTYAVELAADEQSGEGEVSFSQPVLLYVQNFVGIAVGSPVPVGYYYAGNSSVLPDAGAADAGGAPTNSQVAGWVPSTSGVVLKILSVSGGQAAIDVTGGGVAATSTQLSNLGITTGELEQLASLYSVGQSLWRVQIPHFTAWDCNWPTLPGPPPPPPPPPFPPGPPGPGDCKLHGSIISCQERALGEVLPVAGTPYSLHYESNRQRGRVPVLNIPLSGATLPPTDAGAVLEQIQLKVDIAGTESTQYFDAGPNLVTTYLWPGTDAFGRTLQGAQLATVTVSFLYNTSYGDTPVFGTYGNGTAVSSGARTTTASPLVWRGTPELWDGTLGTWDSQPEGLGGWTLSVHHTYDPIGHTIHFGDGTDLTPAYLPGVIQTIAGGGLNTGSSLGNGGPATAASTTPDSVAVGPDGTVYIGDAANCIRSVNAAGIIQAFAGQCSAGGASGYSGDGGPATAAQMNQPLDMVVGPDGSLYFADAGNNRIRKISPAGIISTVAGSGATGSGGSYTGDGGPATSATLHYPTSLDIAPDGTMYIADQDNHVVRRVTPDGIINTIAGGGSVSQNNVQATQTAMVPAFVRVLSDGSLLVADNQGANHTSTGYFPAVRRITTDGVIHQFYQNYPMAFNGLAVGKDSSVYIATTTGSNDLGIVVRIGADGSASTVVGPGTVNVLGDNGPATSAGIGGGGGLFVTPTGTLYIADGNLSRVRAVAPPLPGFSSSTTTAFSFASTDGTQLFEFDGTGRHLRTLNALTNAVLYSFTYDAEGALASVTDVNGDTTQINHGANGNPTTIVAPFGEVTNLSVDSNGYLASVTDPAHEQTSFTNGTTGLMATMTDARGGLHQFAYDSVGRLTQDLDPADGGTTLVETDNANGSYTVTTTSAMGRQTTLGTATGEATGTLSRANTFPDGTQASLSFASNGVTTTTAADGTITTETDTPDPRFGMLAPVRSVTTTTPSGISSVSNVSRTVTLDGGALVTLTETTDLNGNSWVKSYATSTNTWTTTSPVGRTSTVVTDGAGRPLQTTAPSTNPISYTYDAHGRLLSTAQGSSTWTQSYDSQGYLNAVTDALNNTISYSNDAIGRAYQTILADNRVVHTTFDGDSNTTSITLPSPSDNEHLFSYNPVDEIASYEPPSVSAAPTTTTYAYDLDHNVTTVIRPDGITLSYTYNATTGQLTAISYPPGGPLSLTYNPTTGRIATKTVGTGSSAEVLTYAYDGFLPTGLTWSGRVAGSVSFAYNTNFWLKSQSVNGAALTFGQDDDGLLTGAGSETLTYDPNNGRITGTTLGSVTDSYTYDANGLFKSYTADYSGNAIYAESVVRDANQRITQKTESTTVSSTTTTHVWVYTYDVNGRLTEVTKDGNAYSQYGYDADDNRTTYTNAGGAAINPTYDAQDRLLTYGAATYTYTADGELSTKTTSSGTSTYTYDALGNLTAVSLPSESIAYLVDGDSRRVGKEVGGSLTTGYLYKDALNVVAQLNGSGTVVSTFVFGSKPNVPDYFTNSSGTFRILSDHLGSPRLLVNTSTGAVLEEIDYDEFGNVTNDTAPGTIPFGFAGGVYDEDTKLLRFGTRDYDPSVGRWTSKDPIRFSGGWNLYGYSVNDPVNHIDPLGTVGGPSTWLPGPLPDPGPNGICAVPMNYNFCLASCRYEYQTYLAQPWVHANVVTCVAVAVSALPGPLSYQQYAAAVKAATAACEAPLLQDRDALYLQCVKGCPP